MASFYNLTIGQHIEFLRILTGAGLTAEDGKSVIDDPTRARLMIEALQKPPIQSLPDWYVQPEQQMKRVGEFLVQSVAVGSSPYSIPSAPTNFVPRTPTEVLMLAVYLPDQGRKKGVYRTFDALWDLVVPPSGFDKWCWDQLKADTKHLRPLDGIQHRPGVRWVAFDPNANHKCSPKSCWDNPDIAPTLAGPEVLMALALFPDWAASWNGTSSPYPNMTSYQLNWGDVWQYCPCIYRRDVHRRLEINAHSADNAYGCWACPSVREC